MPGAFLVRITPDAGEACIVRRSPRVADELPPDGEVVLDDQAEAWRAERNHERATRRATSESRRYIVGNRLHVMWVLTIGGEGLHGVEGRRVIMRMTAGLVRALRTELGEAFPYWFSPELHPSGHGWHVNLFVGRRFDHGRVKALWQELGGGFEVRFKDWTQDSCQRPS